MRKLPSLIAFRKVLGVALKHHPQRYWISSVFVLFIVMITRAQCLTGIDMGMSHRPSVFFMCTFEINVLPLIILISFLSNILIQSLSNNWPMDISEALCNPSNVCVFFQWALRLLDSWMLLVCFKLIVLLFVNWTVGPYRVSFTFLST